MLPPVLGIIVPCYNEEEVLETTFSVLQGVLDEMKQLGRINAKSYICFVDDGSYDHTWAIIEQLCTNHQSKGIKLSANFGHQNALVAGLFTENNHADCLITIDADLQDDVNIIPRMIDLYHQGYKVIYGVRNSRQTDSRGKRILAQGFYRINGYLNKRSIYNHADFRLADKKVIRHLEEFSEVNLFLRGMFPLIGFPSKCVYFDRKKRTQGKSKYPVQKSISLAWQGITSFSITPLKLIFKLGIINLLIAFILIIWVLWATIAGKAIQGWASTLIPILFFSGLNMLVLGIIGEYVGKIYQEVKRRPRFIIEKQIDTGE
jgi:glycosyltransferase involved in cell wall biosynthesis